jgi:hypothetical protein
MLTFLALFAQVDVLQWLTSAWSTTTDLWSKNPQAIIAIIALAVSLSAVYFQRTVNTQEKENSVKRNKMDRVRLEDTDLDEIWRNP